MICFVFMIYSVKMVKSLVLYSKTRNLVVADNNLSQGDRVMLQQLA